MCYLWFVGFCTLQVGKPMPFVEDSTHPKQTAKLSKMHVFQGQCAWLFRQVTFGQWICLGLGLESAKQVYHGINVTGSKEGLLAICPWRRVARYFAEWQRRKNVKPIAQGPSTRFSRQAAESSDHLKRMVRGPGTYLQMIYKQHIDRRKPRHNVIFD